MNEARLEKTITFRISVEDQRQLEAMSAREERKLADVARRLFRRGLALESKGKKR